MPYRKIDISDIQIIVCKNEPSNFTYNCESRNWDGFSLVTQGSGEFISNKGEKISVSKGSLVLLRKGDSYKFKFDGTCGYITSGFDFSKSCFADIEDLPSCIIASDRQMRNISEMADVWQRHSWDSFMICKIMLLSLYLEILQKVTKYTDCKDSDVRRALSFVHNNFKRNFSIEELSKYCALSPSYLRTKFYKNVGMTITDYRDNLRISSAKEMLKSGMFTIKEISEELGYCDVSHFSKTFSRTCGVTPGKYRGK